MLKNNFNLIFVIIFHQVQLMDRDFLIAFIFCTLACWQSDRFKGVFIVLHRQDIEQGADTYSMSFSRPDLGEYRSHWRKLMEQGTSEEELQLVKNYLIGQSLGQRETLFQIGDILRFSIVNQIHFSELDRKFQVIQDMKTEDVGELASKYLRPDDMLEVVVGELVE